jgi:5-hydroxyisourate hydrolase-like protein (transthyretin family)
MTVTASSTTPVVNQSFTLSGTLKAGSTPLSGKTIRLQREDPSGNWEQAVNTTTTNANGSYSFTWSESAQGQYRFEPTFDGAGAYASANAVIGITIGT